MQAETSIKHNDKHQLDHVGLWHSCLKEGVAELERELGIVPEIFGHHAGQGTHNALYGASQGAYLELIAPDPNQPGDFHLVTKFHSLPNFAPALIAYKSANLPQMGVWAREMGFALDGPKAMSRTPNKGEVIEWQLLFLEHGDFSNLPFFIDWGGSVSPGSVLVPQIDLTSLTFEHPQHGRLHNLLSYIGVPVEVVMGSISNISLTIHSKRTGAVKTYSHLKA